MNILLFENSKDVRSSLIRNIEAIDYNINITAVSRIDEIIDFDISKRFDLAIIDMDYLQGRFREIIYLLKINNPDVVLILLTLFPNINIINKFISKGADFCFDKIGQFDDILEKIRNLAEIRPELNYCGAKLEKFQEA